VEQAVYKDGEGYQEQAYGLIAAEEAALFVTLVRALLAGVEALQSIVHGLRSLPAGSIGSIAKDSALFAWLAKARA
jgi:hypothetical protein